MHQYIAPVLDAPVHLHVGLALKEQATLTLSLSWLFSNLPVLIP